ncbi:MAG TPA: S9 family peptidase [Bacteroides sp.]|nr:S9 family peptidase [Bacteroides sp.]
MKINKLGFLILSVLSITQVMGQGSDREITFDDAVKKRIFSEKRINGLRSMNDGKHYSVQERGKIVKYSYKTAEKVEDVFSVDMLDLPGGGSIGNYAFSSDDSKILVAIGKERIYRHSYRADYYVYDFGTGQSVFLSDNGKQQLATLSPDGNKVAFVRDNNLYFFDLETGQKKRLTDDGEHGKIINGAPDWVYEEEFAFSKGFAWSPDSRRIAYYRTDETLVKKFIVTAYGGGLYPDWWDFKYPKAGETNSIVSIRVVDLDSGSDEEMDTGDETDQYIPRIKWTRRPGELCILRLNRHQNKLDVILADAVSGTSKVILEDENEYYIREPQDETVVFLEDGKHFIYTGDREGYYHFSRYDMEGNEISRITEGEWDIIDFLGLDQKRGILYYTSYEGSSVQSNVWSIKLDGSGKRMISDTKGWNTAEFSKTYDYYIHTHSDVRTPKYITLHNSKGKVLKILEDNARLKERAASYGIPEKELITITTSEGVELNAYMYKPKGFTENGNYPLMMHVYGGPGAQNVQDSWGTSSLHYLLLERGYVIVSVDNRGTAGKGEAFRKATYLQLGKYETIDQIEAAKYLGNIPWIDAERIGIWGGSYGGFMSAMCITAGADVFKLAMAVSSVTNWKYYDTVYTERFMRTPRENPDGYEKNSPVYYADRLKGHLLINHGMVDDNVHMQNSVDLVEALIQAGKQFEWMFYPDQAHGIYQRGAAPHMATKLMQYVEENL